VANQDTFSFNLSNGELKYSGNEYRVPSPNFVFCCPTYQDDDAVEETKTKLLSSATSIVSDSGSESEESKISIMRDIKNQSVLMEDFAMARKEIEELKKMLAAQRCKF
jgi:6-phosphogluconolactonase